MAKSDVALLRNKSELIDALVEYRTRSEVELQGFNLKLTNIRLDQAGEKMSQAVRTFCISNGTHLETSRPYDRPSNGAAERLIQEHWTRTRVLLFSANIATKLWPEAVNHGNWLRNCVPSSKLHGEIPILK